MHEDEQGAPSPLEPLSPDELETIRLVETFALQAGSATTVGDGRDDLGMENVVLLHMATRVNGTFLREVTVVSLDTERFLGLLGAVVEVGTRLYQDRAIDTISQTLDQLYTSSAPVD